MTATVKYVFIDMVRIGFHPVEDEIAEMAVIGASKFFTEVCSYSTVCSVSESTLKGLSQNSMPSSHDGLVTEIHATQHAPTASEAFEETLAMLHQYGGRDRQMILVGEHVDTLLRPCLTKFVPEFEAAMARQSVEMHEIRRIASRLQDCDPWVPRPTRALEIARANVVFAQAAMFDMLKKDPVT